MSRVSIRQDATIIYIDLDQVIPTNTNIYNILIFQLVTVILLPDNPADTRSDMSGI